MKGRGIDPLTTFGLRKKRPLIQLLSILGRREEEVDYEGVKEWEEWLTRRSEGSLPLSPFSPFYSVRPFKNYLTMTVFCRNSVRVESTQISSQTLEIRGVDVKETARRGRRGSLGLWAESGERCLRQRGRWRVWSRESVHRVRVRYPLWARKKQGCLRPLHQ